MLRGNGFGKVGSCSFWGGVAVDPLLISSCRSGKATAFSLVNDLRLQSSVRGGEG